MNAVVQQLPPPERARQCLYHGVVDAKPRRTRPRPASRCFRRPRAEDGGLRAPCNRLMPSVEADLERLGNCRIRVRPALPPRSAPTARSQPPAAPRAAVAPPGRLGGDQQWDAADAGARRDVRMRLGVDLGERTPGAAPWRPRRTPAPSSGRAAPGRPEVHHQRQLVVANRLVERRRVDLGHPPVDELLAATPHFGPAASRASGTRFNCPHARHVSFIARPQEPRGSDVHAGTKRKGSASAPAGSRYATP